MNRELAEKITEQTRKMDMVLGELHDLVLNIDDEAERKRMIRAWGEIVWDVYEKITCEVVKEFPDLHPDKDTDPSVREKLRRATDSSLS